MKQEPTFFISYSHADKDLAIALKAAADEAQPVLAALRALARHSRPAATETLLQPPASCNLEARRAVLAVGSGAWPLIGWTDGRPPGLLSAKVIGERSGFYGETRPTGATRAA